MRKPTGAQLELLRVLADRRRETFVMPGSQLEAHREIRRMLRSSRRARARA